MCSSHRAAGGVLAVLLLAACAAAPEPRSVAVVDERFTSPLTPQDDIDSPASWRAPDGRLWVIATAKATDQLVVYDGATGQLLQRVGTTGTGLGQFRRPNGVFVIGALVLVVERDNRRVQVLGLPEFRPLVAFGQQDLVKPYGLWVREISGGLEVFVTDNYERSEDVVPPLPELGRRVKRYELQQHHGQWVARLAGTFGDTSPEGALRIVESIWGDARHARLLIAEEDESWANEIKVYGIDGRFSGQVFGRDRLMAQAEGIALVECPDGRGYWITTEQGKQQSVFHLFTRGDLRPAGSFRGKVVANTDGIWFHQADPGGPWPAGALFAVHDDQGIVAFDWRDIARGLKLTEACVPGLR